MRFTNQNTQAPDNLRCAGLGRGWQALKFAFWVTAKQESKVQVFWKHLLRSPQLWFHCPFILSCSLSLGLCWLSRAREASWSGRRARFVSLREGEKREPLPRSGGPGTSFSSGATKPLGFVFSHHQVSLYLDLLHLGWIFAEEYKTLGMTITGWLFGMINSAVRDFKLGRTSHLQHRHLILSPVTVNWQRHKLEKPCEL